MSFSTKSVVFDGVSGYVDMGNSPVFQLEYTDTFSISCWAKTNWHHIVVTWAGNASPVVADVTIYIDGVSQTLSTIQDTLSASISNSNDFVIGSRPAGTPTPFDGEIDEVSLYDVVLTSDQVGDLYGFASPVDPTALDSWSDAVGYWKLGEEPPTDGAMTNMVSGDIIANAPKTPGLLGESINYYLMRGVDSACGSLTYHHWTVSGSPDFAGTQAGTLPCGGPLTDITIAASWRVTN